MKYKIKESQIDAFFIDFSKPDHWPVGVQVNAASHTGMSYLSLSEIPVPGEPEGSVQVLGFPVVDLSWLVIDWKNQACNLTADEFSKRYEL